MTAAVPTTTACPRCATEAVAGDRFCEVCGADLAVRRADPADHVEITVDGAAAVGDRGHVRARNEDAVALGRTDGARVPDRVAAVVCDGVSSTRSSQLAARAAADAALDATFPSAGTRLIFPELLAEGLEPHEVRQVYIHGAERADTYVDIAGTMDQKLAALREHRSQMGEWDPKDFLVEWAREQGLRAGLDAAEWYRRMVLEGP